MFRRILPEPSSHRCALLFAFALWSCRSPLLVFEEEEPAATGKQPAPVEPSLGVPFSMLPPSGGTAPLPAPALPASARTEDERNTIDVFARVAPSTVFVTQKRVVIDTFRRQALEVESGSGSGFIWDRQGHVVTNWHVIRGAKTLTVTLLDRGTYPARVIGSEPRKDIAVLAIEAPARALVPVILPRERTRIEVGQKAIAIGNPFGLDHTLTTGTVSALGREVEGAGGVTIKGMVQTDAAINPGNSGGPLLDSSGQLIGMNTMIYSQSGAWAGIGFAVPVETVRRVVPQLIEYGRVREVGLGVIVDPEGRIERAAGVRGVAIVAIQSETPAAKTPLQGIRETPRGFVLGDVIVAVGGHQVPDYDALYNALDGHKPGDRVKLRTVYEGHRREFEIELVLVE